MATTPADFEIRVSAPPAIPAWRRPLLLFLRGGRRGVAIQLAVAAGVALFVAIIAANVSANLSRLGVKTGIEFLARPAGFDISQALIGYEPGSSYFMVFVVALLNTLLVTALSVVLATLLGFVIGLARLSSNGLVSAVGGLYVEAIRNVPLLLQLLFWYFAILQPLPGPRASLSLGDTVFLNNRGLFLPWLELADGGLRLSVPHLAGFNFTGGIALAPELFALTLGLTIYSAAFIAEIVRGGIQAIPRGQIEAARALGLRRGQIARLVQIPLALRAIVPPLGAYYVILLKNSSLGAAIAYPDLMHVMAGTAVNQTGQPVEVMLIMLATYLALGLGISAVTGITNRWLRV
jgi:general L-amino acid transport system permease protein